MIAVDAVTSGPYPPTWKARTRDRLIAAAGGRGRLTLHDYADAGDRGAMEALFSAHRPRAVLHLSAHSGVQGRTPEQYMSNNAAATAALADLAVASRCAALACCVISSCVAAAAACKGGGCLRQPRHVVQLPQLRGGVQCIGLRPRRHAAHGHARGGAHGQASERLRSQQAQRGASVGGRGGAAASGRVGYGCFGGSPFHGLRAAWPPGYGASALLRCAACGHATHKNGRGTYLARLLVRSAQPSRAQPRSLLPSSAARAVLARAAIRRAGADSHRAGTSTMLLRCYWQPWTRRREPRASSPLLTPALAYRPVPAQ